ncbi:MAG: MlaD family protein [Thermodesulfovibrionales bacterium]|nr:MlaD family protein [Thermodesulfovibrionales bacterium]
MLDVKKQLMWSKLKVGIVITTALLILFLTVFFAGGIEEIFSPKVEIQAKIKDVKGLRRGSPVWLAGVEVGFVKRMKLHEEYGTIVTLSIKEDLLGFIKKDSVATVQTMGLLGDKYIELSGGSPDAKPLERGDILEGRSQLEIKDIVDVSAQSINKITEFLDRLNLFIARIEKSEGSLGKFLNDPSLYENLTETTRRFSLIVKDFEATPGTLQRLMKDPTLYEKLQDASIKIEELTAKISKGEGTLGRLATDPTLYENLNDASKRLSEIAKQINEGEGIAGTLLRDKEMALEFKQVVVSLRDIIDELKLLTKDIKEQPKKYFKFSIF